MRSKLKRSLKRRIDLEISGNHKINFLKQVDVDKILDEAIIPVAYLYTRDLRGESDIYFIDLVSAMGARAMKICGQSKNTVTAVRLGSFLLYSLEEMELMAAYKGSNTRSRHACYKIEVTNDRAITKLWKNLKLEPNGKLPSSEPYDAWSCGRHSSGMPLIKSLHPNLLDEMYIKTQPKVFGLVNKLQEIGWNINKDILELQIWAFEYEEEAFSGVWRAPSSQAKDSKLRESEAILNMAQRFEDSEFYHLYSYDFRGRVYPTTAYLHEQGHDQSKGLLLRASRQKISERGLYWLLINMANLWGGDTGDGRKTDKIHLDDRAQWSLDNEDSFVKYAADPRVNKGWMVADKPWQFLANCIELCKFREDPEYASGLLVWIDGSNNGAQHLCALSKDETTAPYVNLTKTEEPGDLYRFVSDTVWASVDKDLMELEDREETEIFVDRAIAVKKSIRDSEPRSEERKRYAEELKVLKASNKHLLDQAMPVFWSRITHQGDRRKICKRGVMTLPYGGTPYGLGEQIIKDASKHGIEILNYMEHRWGAWLGRLIYSSCGSALKRPMQLLKKFEEAGKLAEEDGRFLEWTSQATGFPCVQYYIHGNVRKVWAQYGEPSGPKKSTGYYENTLQLSVSCLEEPVMSPKKQAQGAAPNIIHSLDAAHLSLVVNACDFPVTTVHDSFGCLPEDMDDLYNETRTQFATLYMGDPLGSLMRETGQTLEGLDLGTFSIFEVLESEYAFS